VQNVLFQSRQPAGLRPFELEEELANVGPVRWRVQELLSSWELAAEGTAMGHCVVSYSDQCADGQTSIWSIVLQCPGEDPRESVLTVAVDVGRRAVTHARGKYNMLPNETPRSAQAREAAQGRYGQILNRSDFVLEALDGAGAGAQRRLKWVPRLREAALSMHDCVGVEALRHDLLAEKL
jgi:hypothetical protein